MRLLYGSPPAPRVGPRLPDPKLDKLLDAIGRVPLVPIDAPPPDADDVETATIAALTSMSGEQRARVLRYVASRWPGGLTVTYSDVDDGLLALVCIKVLDRLQ